MNCKQGEMAVIVQCPPRPDCVGRIVECLRFMGDARIDGATFPQVWEVKWGDNDARTMVNRAGWGMPDAWMRPIRDPGEDARDETLDWLPAPTEEMA